ncbi:MAG: hypothetical protein NZ529_08235 [Cytophagaceae bacterium]|nr:hypothetical protein [Cytophagaceae bacterium]MDW8456771.1 hypothetical protein [Cytophagaceae bacterium]
MLYSNTTQAQQNKIKELYLTEQALLAMRIFSFVLCLALLLMSLFANIVSDILKSIKESLFYLVNAVINKYHSMTKSEKTALWISVLLLAIYRCYFMFHYPLMHDEMASYLFFVRNGWLVTLSYYPAPNNHILYNMSCIPFSYLFTDGLHTMRIPVFLMSILLYVAVFFFFYRYYSFKVALCIALIFAFLPLSNLYSVLGRGYMIYTFCALVVVYATMKLYRNPYEKKIWILYSMFSIAGFYTLPVFFYLFLVCTIFLLTAVILSKKQHCIFIFFIAHVVVSIGVILLYMPVLMVSGYKALFQHSWAKPMSTEKFIHQLPNYLSVVSQALIGFDVHAPLILLFLTIMLSIYLWIRKKNHVLYFLFMFVAILFVIFLQRLHPFPRIWIYAEIGIAFAISCTTILTSNYLKKYRDVFYVLIVSCVAAGYCLYPLLYEDSVFDHYRAMHQTTKNVVLSGAKQIYVDHDDYYLSVLYHVAKNNIQGITVNHKDLQSDYDVFITNKKELHTQLSERYRLWMENTDVKVYKTIK